MNLEIKKKISVVLAILVGVCIVSLAWGWSHRGEGVDSSDETSWLDSLRVIPQSTPSKTLKAVGSVSMASAGATTTTDIIARRLLLEYTNSQIGASTSTISDSEIARIANVLVQQVPSLQEKQYSLKDLNISQDNTYDAVLAYKQSLTSLVKKQALSERQENDLSILLSAMNTKDSGTLQRLSVKTDLYAELIKALLTMKTPSSLAPIHLHLVQSYEVLRSSTEGMQKMLVDPALGVVALARYQSGVEGLSLTEQEYNSFNFEN